MPLVVKLMPDDPKQSWSCDQELKPFLKLKDELSVYVGIILRGS